MKAIIVVFSIFYLGAVSATDLQIQGIANIHGGGCREKSFESAIKCSRKHNDKASLQCLKAILQKYIRCEENHHHNLQGVQGRQEETVKCIGINILHLIKCAIRKSKSGAIECLKRSVPSFVECANKS